MIAMDWRGGLKVIAVITSLLVPPLNALAESGRADYDLDDDGLIEINDLSDLDEIRNNPTGKSLYSVSTGCPLEVCTGFELTTDLDFDTNLDGNINVEDDFWNNGEGWLPISGIENLVFSGNDFQIKNLYIDSSATHNAGLFGRLAGAKISNLGLTGPLMMIKGHSYVGSLAGWISGDSSINFCYSTGSVVSDKNFVGGLVGYLNASSILNSYSTGDVTGANTTWNSWFVGGLAGYLTGISRIERSYSTGIVTGQRMVGGLVGSMSSNNRIEGSFATGNVIGERNLGGLVGRLGDIYSGGEGNVITASFATGSVTGIQYLAGLIGTVDEGNEINASFSTGFINAETTGIGGLIHYGKSPVNNSYWAIDTSNVRPSIYVNEDTGFLGLNLSTIQCGIQANTTGDNSHCVSVDGSAENLEKGINLFKNWDQFGYIADSGEYQAYWDFGSVKQLPGLNINGIIYRDSDADGELDTKTPAWLDTDGDGVSDLIDFFPENLAAAIDTDHDGYPDEWLASCDENCQLNSTLQLDPYLNDSDNDGAANNLDAFVLNAAASVDIDNDGRPDSWSLNCDESCQAESGLVLDTHIIPVRADYDLDDDGLIEINNLNDLDDIRRNLTGKSLYGHNIGCPDSEDGTEYGGCFGFELTENLDFDSNQDGVLDENDTYWNSNNSGVGEGWLPIGYYLSFEEKQGFSAVFEGNNFQINNLFINRENSDYVGLFGYVTESEVRNLGLGGELMRLKGRNYIGGLIGKLDRDSKIKSCFNLGLIEGQSYVGGLIGDSNFGNTISVSFSVNKVQGQSYVGGLIGQAGYYSAIENSYSTANVSGVNYIGGLIGYIKHDSTKVSTSYSANKVSAILSIKGGLIGHWVNPSTVSMNSYWAKDSTTQNTSVASDKESNYIGLNLATMQCAVQANTNSNNSDCVSVDGSGEGFESPVSLYQNWDVQGDTDEQGIFQSYWEFGSEFQLPALRFNGVALRDSDGDGILDNSDLYPYDSDNDAVNNRQDFYPFVSLDDRADTDADGVPDVCEQACLDLGMAADVDDDNDGILDHIDTYPLISIGVLIDSDMDGAPDNCDQICVDLGMAADLDDDNDGIVDAADAYPLIAIGELRDADIDGAPNECDQACIELGMSADSDDDNDGILDESDIYPLISIGDLVDTDYDGAPDACDDDCQALGMEADNDIDGDGIDNGEDAFVGNAAASVDMDVDGRPDFWAENCTIECQVISGLVLDTFLNDTDNDGLSNFIDSDDNNDEIIDVDSDSDGLIEITSWEQLNAMRYQLDGSGLRLELNGFLDQSGCPFIIYEENYQQRCHGYELTTDLDFDTNADGVFDELDTYWNGGEGWLPIGNWSGEFSATFDGQGNVIKNLYINRPALDNVGLFGILSNAVIRHLGLTGHLMSITGDSSVGGLAGNTYDNNNIQASYVIGLITGNSFVGGLIGSSHGSDLVQAIYTMGNVTGDDYIGSVIGSTYSDTQILASYSTVSLSSTSNNGFIGYANILSSMETSYWYYDHQHSFLSFQQSAPMYGHGLSIATFRCVTNANTLSNDSECADLPALNEPLMFFENWDTYGQVNSDDVFQPYWNFGTNQQLPALIINGVLHRDNDGDGLFDEQDEDDDNDGVMDINDAYPLFSLEELADTDGDGQPNECDSICFNSGMEADSDDDNDGINDVNDLYSLIAIGELQDTDNDGAPDDCDQTCIDSGLANDTDDDNDGILDAMDAYPLIAIGNLIDTDGDGSPNDCDQTCIELGMLADSDDDNDGILDFIDVYPLIAIGELIDTDSDGAPNDCNQACIDLGMLSDSDDDNDAIFDESDNYPLISIGDLTDTDNDGAPNECDQACIELGMAADSDDDNDGILDFVDIYPLIAISELIDTDSDGAPNECDQSCINLGMSADADDDNDGVLDEIDFYPLISVAQFTDTDVDGIPDNCDISCLSIGMLADTDDDNDGLLDEHDGYSLIPIDDFTDTDNDGVPNECNQYCLDLGMIADSDDDNDGIFDEEDAYPLVIIGELTDTDSDGAPNECDQACIDSGLAEDDDDDGDGISDAVDAYPLLAIGDLTDTDNDGAPNDCNQACIDLGMQADSDDDNDEIVDESDFYPLISIGELTDTDNDGAPDECDQACIDSGLSADTDDDNDGILDVVDVYPLVAIAELTDTDGDGAPNECGQDCIGLGMQEDIDDDNDGVADIDDSFPLDFSVSEDSDLDGLADSWNESCNTSCQELSMQILDIYLADFDNDGVRDDQDLDNTQDNGSPELFSVPPNMNVSVNSNDGKTVLIVIEDSEFTAYDAVDTSLIYTASIGGVLVERDELNQMSLPSGKINLDWIATDSAGNLSETISQIINVYPNVAFSKTFSVSGENNDATISVELSGQPPVYPVTILWQVDQISSDISQEDINVDFDLSLIHEANIDEANEGEEFNGSVNFFIPIVQDNLAENDELLFINLIGVENNEENLYQLVENKSQHQLTVTHENLAPQVQLELLQEGVEVANITRDGGEVTVRAHITDANGDDEHTLEWDLSELEIESPIGNAVRFTPANLEDGEYKVSVKVTDTGLNQLTAEASLIIHMVKSDLEAINESVGALWWLTWLLAGVLIYREKNIY